ncbi:unnamed protein product (macronuclear) [Paramecium tetraurelia]|uniref:GB1/RHD3-type G domain-containing protein n=1 Tax=Paramecium tetraurelia TaxID=5888 RepID=A0C177_PARTE|nr:uncharacterized protein GSPATT00034020001 [Paramecium tetraurelia]CAK64544.1 unnamed protein product [Paramecium tetraurelia]|eukprot:XP_001431942.1 hypothetical protein (macronuclear) [Paramecium tetraurelia strain d4-2]
MNAPKAIPFIKYINNQFQVDPQAEQFLTSLGSEKLGVVSIVGKYRTGKSFFVNRVLLNQQAGGFSVGPTINPCTKGLWIWSQTITAQNAEFPDMKAIIIDTEGFGGMDENVNHDTRIFLFSLLLSSYFIYNSVGNIDENALNTLNLIVNLAKDIQQNNENTFPQFLWIVRDFALQMVDQQGNPINPKQYLENSLELLKGLSDSVEQKNRIRRMIKHFFKERDCMTMVRPVEREEDLQRLDTLHENSFRGEFVQQLKEARSKIFKRVRPKSVQGSMVNGIQLLQLAKAYVDLINGGKVPNVESAWGYVCKAEGERALRECINMAEQSIEKLKNQVIQDLPAVKQQLLEQVRKQFRLKAIGSEDDLKQFTEKLAEQFEDKFKELKQSNKRNLKNHQSKVLQPHIENILEKLKNDEFSNYYELQSEMFKIRDQFQKEVGRNQQVSQLFDEMSLQIYQQAAEKLTRKASQQTNQENKQLQYKVQNLEKELKALQDDKHQLELQAHSKLEKLSKENELLSKSELQLKTQFQQIQQQTHQVQQQSQHQIQQHDKQLALVTQENAFLQKEIQSLNDRSSQLDNENKKLRQELITQKAANEQLQQKCHSLDYGRAQEIQKLQLEFEKKIQELNNDIDSKKQTARQQSEWMVEKSYLENQVTFLKSQLDENKRLHDALLIALQSQNNPSNDYQESTLELLETNRNLSAAMDKMEMRCKQLEEKVTKLKKFKKIFKNSSSIVCINCNRQYQSNGFSQHLSTCIDNNPLQSNSLNLITYEQRIYNNNNTHNQSLSHPLPPPIDLSQLQISINQTMVRETPDNKPYTEYMIRVQYNLKKWTISRRYKNFCELHQAIIQQYPNLKMPESSSAIINTADIGSVFNAKRPTVIEDRRRALQSYIRDLAKLDPVRNSTAYRKFLELDTIDQVEQPSRSMSQMGSPKNEGLQSSRDYGRESLSVMPKPFWKQSTQQIAIGASTSREQKYEDVPPQNNYARQKENQPTSSTSNLNTKIDRKLLPQSPQSFLKAFQKQQETSKVYKMHHQHSLLEISGDIQ